MADVEGSGVEKKRRYTKSARRPAKNENSVLRDVLKQLVLVARAMRDLPAHWTVGALLFLPLTLITFLEYRTSENVLPAETGTLTLESLSSAALDPDWPMVLAAHSEEGFAEISSIVADSEGTLLTDLIMSPDGNWVASIAANGGVLIKQTGQFNTPGTLIRPNNRRTIATFSSDSTQLITVGNYGSLQIWDLADLSAPIDETPVGFTPVQVTASSQGTIALLDGPSRNITLWERGPEGLGETPTRVITSPYAINVIQFNPTGGAIAAGTKNGKVYFWSSSGVPTAEPSDRGLSDGSPVTALAFSPEDDGALFAGYQNGTVLYFLMDLGTVAEVMDLSLPVKTIAARKALQHTLLVQTRGAEMMRDLGLVYSLSIDGIDIGVPQSQGPKESQFSSFNLVEPAQILGDVRFLAAAADRIAVANSKGIISDVDPTGANSAVLGASYSHQGTVRALLLTQDGSRLLAANGNGRVRQFDVSGTAPSQIGVTDYDGPAIRPAAMALHFEPGDDIVQLNYGYPSVVAFASDASGAFTGQAFQELSENDSLEVRGLSFARNAQRLATIEDSIEGDSGYLVFRDIDAANSALWSFKLYDYPSLVAVSDNGQQVLVGPMDFPDGHVLYHVESELVSQQKSLPEPNLIDDPYYSSVSRKIMTQRPRALAFLPGSSRRFAVSTGARILIKTMAETQPIQTISTLEPAYNIKFSDDGSYLAYTSENGVYAHVADAAGQYGPAFPVTSSHLVLTLAVANDGRVFTGDSEGNLAVYRYSLIPVRPPLWSLAFAALLFLWLFIFGLQLISAYYRAGILEVEVANAHVRQFLEADVPLNNKSTAGKAMVGLTERLFNFVTNRDTSPPLTFALLGEWGSGKSSVMNLLQHDLRKKNHPVVWFNAWHHQNEEHLFASLMETIRKKTPVRFFSLANLKFRVRLFAIRLMRAPVLNTLRITAVIVLTWVVSSYVAGVLQDGTLPSGQAGAGTAAAGLLTVFASAWVFAGKLFKPFVQKPAQLLKQSAGLLQLTSFQSKLGFRHQFAEAFADVCNAFGPDRLVLIIDDLDRCKPDLVIEVLEAVNFLITSGKCFIFLGISEEPVMQAVGLSFDKMAKETALGEAASRPAPEGEEGTDPPQRPSLALVSTSDEAQSDGPGTPLTAEQEMIDEYKARRDFAERYMEKLINLRIEVPQLDMGSLRDWMHNAANSIEYASTVKWMQVAAVAIAVSVASVGLISVNDVVREALAPEKTPEQTNVQSPASAPAGGSAAEIPADSSDNTATADSSTPGDAAANAPDTLTDTASAATEENSSAADPADSTPASREVAVATGGAEGDGQSTETTAAAPGADYTAETSILLLLLAGLLSLRIMAWFRNRASSGEEPIHQDTGAFREAFNHWILLVLARKKSPRAVKRFANRMRYLVAGESQQDTDNNIHQLMALGALDEIGLIVKTDTLDVLQGGKFRSKFDKALAKLEGDISDVELPDLRELGMITQEDWDHYWDLASSVRFSNPKPDEPEELPMEEAAE